MNPFCENEEMEGEEFQFFSVGTLTNVPEEEEDNPLMCDEEIPRAVDIVFTDQLFLYLKYTPRIDYSGTKNDAELTKAMRDLCEQIRSVSNYLKESDDRAAMLMSVWNVHSTDLTTKTNFYLMDMVRGNIQKKMKDLNRMRLYYLQRIKEIENLIIVSQEVCTIS